MRIVALVAALVLVCASAALFQFRVGPAHVLPEWPDETYEQRLVALQKNLTCLRDLVYTEARGESYEGRHMVAYVAWQRFLENRPYWGKGSLCNVVYKQVSTKKGLVSQFSGPVNNPVPEHLQSHELREAFYAAWRVV